MNYNQWEPVYREILDYFGFDRALDEEAARLLASLLARDDLALLELVTKGRVVTVCGNAPCLKDELGKIGGTVFAADAALDVLVQHGIRADAVFTDLDGATDTLLRSNREGTIAVVHAHGDNMPLLRHWVPLLTGPTVATTQSRPLPHVHNFGGFTDGDRAAFAANSLGAARIIFAGFDLDDPEVEPFKRGKLIWARKLLAMIGYEL